MSKPNLQVTFLDVNIMEAINKYSNNTTQENLAELRAILNIQNLPANFGVDFALKIQNNYKETIEQMLVRVCNNDDAAKNISELLEDCGVKNDSLSVRLEVLRKNSKDFFIKREQEREEENRKYRQSQQAEALSQDKSLNLVDVKKQIEERQIAEMNLKREWKEWSGLQKEFEQGKTSQVTENITRLLQLTEKFEKLKQNNPELFAKISKEDSQEVVRKGLSQKMFASVKGLKNLFAGKNKKVAISNSPAEGAATESKVAYAPRRVFLEEAGAAEVSGEEEKNKATISSASAKKLDEKGKGRARGDSSQSSPEFSEFEI